MKIIITTILLLFCFILPIQFFIIGDGIGTGMEGAFYQIKITGFGSSLTPVTNDIQYGIAGIYSGKTFISVIFWIIGSAILMSASFIGINEVRGSLYWEKIVCILILSSGGFYLLSVIVQYGPLLHGPAGISIPFGIPVIIIFGYLLLKGYMKNKTRFKT
jgi:hypothetical protein